MSQIKIKTVTEIT